MPAVGNFICQWRTTFPRVMRKSQSKSHSTVKGIKWMANKVALIYSTHLLILHKYGWLMEFVANMNVMKPIPRYRKWQLLAREHLFAVAEKENIQLTWKNVAFCIFSSKLIMRSPPKWMIYWPAGGLEKIAVTPADMQKLHRAKPKRWIFTAVFIVLGMRQAIFIIAEGLAEASEKYGVKYCLVWKSPM